MNVVSTCDSGKAIITRRCSTYLSDCLVQLHCSDAATQTSESSRAEVERYRFSHAQNSSLLLLAAVTRQSAFWSEDFAVDAKDFGIVHHSPTVPANLCTARGKLLDSVDFDTSATVRYALCPQTRHRRVNANTFFDASLQVRQLPSF